MRRRAEERRGEERKNRGEEQERKSRGEEEQRKGSAREKERSGCEVAHLRLSRTGPRLDCQLACIK